MKIHFYLHPARTMYELHYTACLLAEKIYQSGRFAYFLCESVDQVKQLDSLLWTYAEDVFVPHQCYASALSDNTRQIQIGHRAISSCPKSDFLINMSEITPPHYQQFKCVIELISQDAKQRQAGRIKYRRYQQDGCELLTHHIET